MSLKLLLPRAAAPSSRIARTRPALMPLRAKIVPQTVAQRHASWMAQETDEKKIFREQPGDELDDVIFTSQYGLRSIELNRPKKLNSLNASMIRKIGPRLKEWESSELANIVLLKGSGRALCAGGDVAALAKWDAEGSEGQQRSSDYFALEYKLDHLIATYSKPYVAVMDGITMGGGVGLSVHAPFRIATENTVFAMPETTIGFFPDVGASFFLPKMDGNLGTYLALTSEQLRGVDIFYHGIATHYIHSTSLPALEARLGELQFKDRSSLADRFAIINSTIEEFVTGLESPRPKITGAQRAAIDKIFEPTNDIDRIQAALEDLQSGPLGDWASKTLATLRKRSPTSVLVTLKQLRDARAWSIAEAFQREHAIASRFMAHPDFVEGVTEQLIKKGDQKKPRPTWAPASFDAVRRGDIEAFFADPTTLRLLKDEQKDDYTRYPHEWIGLPAEADIVAHVVQGESRVEGVIADFVQGRDGKLGVKEKVMEVLYRRFPISTDGIVGAV